MKQYFLKTILLSLFVFYCFVSSANNNSSKLHLQNITKTCGMSGIGVCSADTVIPIDTTITISGMSVSGHISLNNNDDSYIVITMTDSHNVEHLVYETYKMLADASFIILDNAAYETAFLDNVSPKTMNLYIHHASLCIDAIHYDEDIVYQHGVKIARVIHNQSEEIIEKLNDNLERRGALWRAGITSMSDKTYEEKKAMFGGTVPQLYGFEYYRGGIFVLPSDDEDSDSTISSRSSNQYVSEWDWRNRHGKNWMTSVKNQDGCSSCWAFSTVGTFEAYINLYYNQYLDYDLSEQEILSCGDAGNCNSGHLYKALEYVCNSGIVPEECFPYIAFKDSCESENKCESPADRLSYGQYSYAYTTDEDSIKRMLFKSPICFGIRPWFHFLVLVGFKQIASGDYYFTANNSSYMTSVSPNNPLVGHPAWLIKNSWGNWGNSGYGYVAMSLSRAYEIYKISGSVFSQVLNDTDIVCSDDDEDGYYSWGGGPKPSNCPSWIPNNQDGDDSNPCLGPIDEYGICDTLTTNPAITWYIDSNVSYNVTDNFTYPNIVILQNGTLAISNSIMTMKRNATIRVQNGGKLIIDGGQILEANILIENGGTLIINNNGVLHLRDNGQYITHVGAKVLITHGKIE